MTVLHPPTDQKVAGSNPPVQRRSLSWSLSSALAAATVHRRTRPASDLPREPPRTPPYGPCGQLESVLLVGTVAVCCLNGGSAAAHGSVVNFPVGGFW